MNKEELFNAIHNADDKYVEEILPDPFESEAQYGQALRPVSVRPKLWKIAAATAACAAVVGGALLVHGKSVNLTTSDPISTSSSISEDYAPASEQSTASDSTSDNTIYIPEIDINGNTSADPVPSESTDPNYIIAEVMPLKKMPGHYFGTGSPGGDSFKYLKTELGEEVFAVKDGEVIFSDYLDVQSGYNVIIKHSDNMFTQYGALNTYMGIPVKTGDKVKAGQVIGYTGYGLEFLLGPGLIYGELTSDSVTILPSPEYFEREVEAINEWLQKPLVYPLKNISKNFSFDNRVAFTASTIPENPVHSRQGEEVYAVDGGRISYIEQVDGFGWYVKIQHDNGVFTCYYNLYSVADSIIEFLSAGKEISAGTVIGYASDSGLGYCVGRLWLYNNYPNAEELIRSWDEEAAQFAAKYNSEVE